jgi:hypothetical protein
VAKEKISVTVDAGVLHRADGDARAAGLNRSELVERALRHEHLRMELRAYVSRTAPSLGVEDYADTVYRANLAAGL